VHRLLTLAVLIALAWPATAQAFRKTDVRVPMDDGVSLAATLYLPDLAPNAVPPPGGWPGLVLLHGLGGRRTDMNLLAELSFANQGYAVLSVDLRGHGESGGLFSGAGRRDVADARALHAWLGSRMDVDEARIGALGISLGGGVVWGALAAGVPFAAAAVAQTWTDLYGALAPQDLAKSGAVAVLGASVPTNRQEPELASIVIDALAGRNRARLRAWAAERSSLAGLRSVRTPVLVFQGRRDFVFGLEQSLDAFTRLAGEKRLYIGPFGHVPSSFPGPDAAQLLTRGTDWFARFLQGVPNGIDAGRPVELVADPYAGAPGARYASLPPTRALSLRATGRRTVRAGGSSTHELGRTAALTETFGTPTVRLLGATGSFRHVVAALIATAPGGRRVTVAAGGVATTLGARPRSVTIRLAAQATTIPAGSRLTLRIGSTWRDGLHVIPARPGSRLSIRGATVVVPVLRTPVSR
jgi:uncharacterized protein